MDLADPVLLVLIQRGFDRRLLLYKQRKGAVAALGYQDAGFDGSTWA
jgi:hypothetical protein